MMEPLDSFLVRAYLDGEMDEATAQAFEIRLIEEPELAEFVDADYALGAGLKAAGADLRQSDPAPPATAAVVALATPKPGTHARRLGRVVPWLAAAGVVLATGIGVGRLSQPPPPLPRAALEPAVLVNVDKTRGAVGDPVGTPMEETLPASGPVVLFVPVLSAPCLARIEIQQGGATLIAEAQADGVSKFANLVVDASRLATGSAVFAVGCTGDKPVKYAMRFKRG